MLSWDGTDLNTCWTVLKWCSLQKLCYIMFLCLTGRAHLAECTSSRVEVWWMGCNSCTVILYMRKISQKFFESFFVWILGWKFSKKEIIKGIKPKKIFWKNSMMYILSEIQLLGLEARNQLEKGEMICKLNYSRPKNRNTFGNSSCFLPLFSKWCISILSLEITF